ncbi:hypothetical protein [Aureibacter tunicatorum]|uniref:Uncharacterized protein n=1 Tax=Aureibacter tunicatorum TaxID=866807 RepID=A0AAE3XNV3_9BACT|nr:hypothetical protein [Aureibacter tunicatorum]MDR6240003.1 hypothetical protein [Aureibacter tunicatorum]BDD04475.1 hypothetical protein AUTU_19580 [Aureibacter tunicatorum]
MKKFILSAFVAASLFSCNKNSELDNSIDVVEEREIQGVRNFTFKIGGEFISKSEQELSRLSAYSDTTIHYLVQVDKLISGQGGGAMRSKSIRSNFAWGIFDDLALINIDLADGAQYQFDIIAIKSTPESGLEISSEGILGTPYNRPVTNEFTFESTFGLDVFSTRIGLEEENGEIFRYRNYPAIECYTGEKLINLAGGAARTTSTNENVIEINLYKATFGYKFKLNNLQAGYVEINMAEKLITMDSDSTSSKRIFSSSLGQISASERSPGYLETTAQVPTTITWFNDETGEAVELHSAPLGFKRNTLTTYNITLPDNLEQGPSAEPESNFAITLEEAPMTEVEGGEVINQM